MEGSLRTDSCVLCVYRKIEAFTRVLTCALQECSHSVWTPEDTWAILETIDSAIGCFQHSEFDLVDADWSGDMNDIDGILSDCLAWTHKPVVAQGDERVIQMAKSLLPVIKMSRFLSHFQPYCKMWLPHSTGMSSQELEDLREVPHNLIASFESIVQKFDQTHLQTPAEARNGPNFIT
jgi:hypothetical protein